MKERDFVILVGENVKSEELDIVSGSACVQVNLSSPRACFFESAFRT